MDLKIPKQSYDVSVEAMNLIDGGYYYSRQENWWGVRVFYTKRSAEKMAQDLRWMSGMWAAVGLIPGVTFLGFAASMITEWVREDIASAAGKASRYVQINWGYSWWPDIYYG